MATCSMWRRYGGSCGRRCGDEGTPPSPVPAGPPRFASESARASSGSRRALAEAWIEALLAWLERAAKSGATIGTAVGEEPASRIFGYRRKQPFSPSSLTTSSELHASTSEARTGHSTNSVSFGVRKPRLCIALIVRIASPRKPARRQGYAGARGGRSSPLFLFLYSQ